MKKGGTGSTKSGSTFEGKTDLITFLSKQKGYTIKKETDETKIFYNKEHIASSYKKHMFYKYLEREGVKWKNLISRKLFPDEALFVKKKNTLYILEMKFQEREGSTDEKLQTCDFKLQQYKRLVSEFSVTVQYIFVLNDWFKKEGYKDVLKHITDKGCSYYFTSVPIKELGLPDSSA